MDADERPVGDVEIHAGIVFRVEYSARSIRAKRILHSAGRHVPGKRSAARWECRSRMNACTWKRAAR